MSISVSLLLTPPGGEYSHSLHGTLEAHGPWLRALKQYMLLQGSRAQGGRDVEFLVVVNQDCAIHQWGPPHNPRLENFGELNCPDQRSSGNIQDQCWHFNTWVLVLVGNVR